jgi:hypothetical protein
MMVIDYFFLKAIKGKQNKIKRKVVGSGIAFGSGIALTSP